jgi:hypothetical protein
MLERMRPATIRAWIAEQPEGRVALAASLVGRNFSSDSSLASQLVGEFGDKHAVANSFFSEYVAGSWSGPASSHWLELANNLQTVAGNTTLPKLRRWATDSSRTLFSMAEREREREEEESLRFR